MTSPSSTWRPVRPISADNIFQARAQLHQAVQLLTAVGISFVPQRPDDSHTSILWSAKSEAFFSQPFGNNHRFQLALNPVNLTCSVIEADGSRLVTLNLNGATLEQTFNDLKFFLEDHGLPRDVFTMERHFELPDYPDRWNSAFDTSDTQAFELLSNAYSNAYPFIQNIAQHNSKAGDQLIWPHHFDMAILISMDEDKSIGIGLSPGDDSYSTPYYYVNVWPYPSPEQSISYKLSFGDWHTAGWTGMVLSYDQLSGEGDPSRQKTMVDTFLREALAHAHAVIESQ